MKVKLASSCGSGSTIIRPAPSAPFLEGARPTPAASSRASSTSITTKASSDTSTTSSSSSVSFPGADGEHGPSDKSKLRVSGSDGYTRDEIDVLSDPDGKLSLSPKQRASFSHWARLEELSADPKIIEVVDCFSIRQTVVSDCSFVASLAVSGLYEKRFKKKIITSIQHNQEFGFMEVYNPCGKYTVKLNINGVPRKVVIDDYLPMGRHSEMLCSYSSNKNEFWVSLLEKAYMKVMGGYDFPGSNSNIDLHALTGWIPERVSLHGTADAPFNSEALFGKLLDRHQRGDVLVTLATGELSEADAERSGLVPSHAYAMLDVREVQGRRLFLLKNPWSHLRWKGRYSERDTTSWTPALAQALRYDPRNAAMFDNGVFWIDYDSVCHFFDVAYLNWNPNLFQYTYCTHRTWNAGTGPVKDLYNIGENPQFSLELSRAGCAVWILLTRHITDREDFANNREYIALLVYKNHGKKVYLPFDPPPFIDGVRINSPHYLCKMVVPQTGTHATPWWFRSTRRATPSTTRCGPTAASPSSWHPSGTRTNTSARRRTVHGQRGRQVGVGNHPETYGCNPVYQVSLQSPHDHNQVLVSLKGPKQYQIGFDIVTVTTNNPSSPDYFSRKGSGMFKSGFTVLELERVPAGVYNVIPSTFKPFQEGPFFLTISATCPFKMSRLSRRCSLKHGRIVAVTNL
ncbi:hypothetical protein HPB48_015102 [Haemaphysalis longicornis]|uniref:Calpain catalytic domain-containing protein n=1 Tax=Haemaphysalis longicornis TaxID=44386 RepID=A0A9J6G5C0_HAELO|nr:hypothetical protein HPB48_015102 [Haemaphysalis longicornis]